MSQPGRTTRSKTSEQDGLSHHLKQGMPSTVSELELLVRKRLEPITNAIKALPSTGYLNQKVNELNNLKRSKSYLIELITCSLRFTSQKMPVKRKNAILTIWNNMGGENA